jgi:hypothetical protein
MEQNHRMTEFQTTRPQFPHWEVEPWSAAGLKRLAVAIAVILIVSAAAIHRVAGLIGMLIAAIIIYGLFALAIWLVVSSGRRAVSSAPPGTLFAGHGYVPVAYLGSHPHFEAFSAGARLSIH